MTDLPTISQEMIRLYDRYTHVTLDRRDLVAQLAKLAGSTAAALALLPMIEANQARAAIVPEDDKRLWTDMISWPGANGTTMRGYIARPAAISRALPAVMVIHENRGLNPHIRDVVRRTALAGFLALGPDFLSPTGGTPANEDEARAAIQKLDPAQTVANAVATVRMLAKHNMSTGKVGAVGFCWGGALVNRTAIAAGDDLEAGVAYYGSVPDAAEVPKIKARMMLHYAGLDERINAGIPAYRAALEQAGVRHVIHMYEGVNHAFNNDTSAARYDKTAAELAWSRTTAFLKDALAG